ncbi:hypothetical protein [Pseudokineococcus lusitanus]|uniref:Subtilisin inhibitor-like n=1 Tax=Pseudokineococcus lusitanus TaxID=763993 RepID=A0A3N1HQV4_9ACTN|nr:hypothetical protein [Pseudokineococcus lusitanus]ROP44885.1 hypothetical protein EDC03_1015 [Pseudokineococcus lusitanus]
MTSPTPAPRPTADRPRRPSRAALVLPALALAALVGACGQPTTPGAGGGSAAPTSAPATPGTTPPASPTQAPPSPSATGTAGTLPGGFEADVSVAYDDGAGTGTTFDLTCGGEGAVSGTVEDPVAACEALAAGVEALQAPTGDAACTMIFGGSQTAVVSGTVAGEPVSADLSRSDGCEIDRWDALVPLLPAVGGAGS